MLHVALVEPEIAANTGNIGRLCVATGVRLHLVGRLGFRLEERRLRRVAIDYWDKLDLVRHADGEAFTRGMADQRVLPFSAQGRLLYTQVQYADGDCLLFGCESQGLPRCLLEQFWESSVRVPMPAGGVRSLNLATTVGIALYEALRQICRW